MRKRHLHFHLVLAAWLAAVTLASAEPARWEDDIAAFEDQDRANPPRPGGVLFIGSSSIRLWKTLDADFPGVATVNRGFGGSQIEDSVAFFDRLVIPHRPRLVVFYAGTNDINGGKPAEQVAADFRAFCDRLHTTLPETRIIFISMVLAPARWERRAQLALGNTYIAAFCAADPRRRFLDVNSAMLSPEGEARPELFVDDRLHMSPPGYAIWRERLAPLLR